MGSNPPLPKVGSCASAQGCRFEGPYLLTPQTDDRDMDPKQTRPDLASISGSFYPYLHVHGLRGFQPLSVLL
jgi:hypothetical protein